MLWLRTRETFFLVLIFFKDLREVGKVAEKEMYEATKGINTHKGTIFSMGILLAVLGVHLKENKKNWPKNFKWKR